MGTFFSLGGGGGVYTPPTPKNFACGEQKKGRWFLRKVFYYVKKIAIPPQPVLAGGMEVTPHTPPRLCLVSTNYILPQTWD
jgi:hypothetical protein